MRFSTFLYSVKQGMKNIGRNKMFSLASIATMAACIFLFGIFFSVVTNFKTMVKTAEEGVAVTVFFEKGIEQDKIDEIGKEIKKRPEVAKYDFVSADEAWKDFQKEYFKGNKEAAEGFEEDNPLANSSHYEIYLNDVSMQKALVTYLKGLDGVRGGTSVRGGSKYSVRSEFSDRIYFSRHYSDPHCCCSVPDQ